MNATPVFDHEKLDCYQKALAFAGWAEHVLERLLPKNSAIYNQLDRARTSIVLNIAEGNGRFTPADRCKFFDIARGSSLECAGCLDLLFIRQQIPDAERTEGKLLLRDIVSLLVGLIRAILPTDFMKRRFDIGAEKADDGSAESRRGFDNN